MSPVTFHRSPSTPMSPNILTAPPTRRSTTYCTADAQTRISLWEKKIPGGRNLTQRSPYPSCTVSVPPLDHEEGGEAASSPLKAKVSTPVRKPHLNKFHSGHLKLKTPLTRPYVTQVTHVSLSCLSCLPF